MALVFIYIAWLCLTLFAYAGGRKQGYEEGYIDGQGKFYPRL